MTPNFTITNAITRDLTMIERARGFLDAATLSDEWVKRMSQRALLLEAHHNYPPANLRQTCDKLATKSRQNWRQREESAVSST